MLGSLDESDTTISLNTPFLKEYKSSQEFKVLAKVLVVGDSRSGKSCLFRRFSDDLFSETYRATSSVEFRHRYITTSTARCKLQVWDCVSTTSSHIMTSVYKGANAVILTVDVSKANALASVAGWLAEIRKLSSADTEIYMVTTKIDLVDERKFTSEEANAMAEANDASYIEVSSKSGKNVDSLFFKIVNDIEANRVMRSDSVDDSSLTQPMLLASDGAASDSPSTAFVKMVFQDCFRSTSSGISNNNNNTVTRDTSSSSMCSLM